MNFNPLNTLIMNKIHVYTFLSLFLVLAMAFSSCKRDEPVLEDDQEEYDAVEVTFTPVNNSSVPVKVIFNRFGSPERTQYLLKKNEVYDMQISLFHEGENINQEVEEESAEHQFFFFASEQAVSDYRYLDGQLGLTGKISFGNIAELFDLKVLLRHGLNKDSPAAKSWNSPNYVEAGGVDDLVLFIPIVLQ